MVIFSIPQVSISIEYISLAFVLHKTGHDIILMSLFPHKPVTLKRLNITSHNRGFQKLRHEECLLFILNKLVFCRVRLFLPSWLHLSLFTCCSTCSSGFGAEPLSILSGSVWECWIHLLNFDFSQANMLMFTLKVQH